MKSDVKFQGITKDYHIAMKAAETELKKKMMGDMDGIDWEKCKPFYTYLAKNIGIQKTRIGGNFAVAHEVTTKNMRSHIRTILPDVIFVTLSLTKDTQSKRITERHGDVAEEIVILMGKHFDMYEKPVEDEKNTYNIDITEDMTPKHVLAKVLEILEKNC